MDENTPNDRTPGPFAHLARGEALSEEQAREIARRDRDRRRGKKRKADGNPLKPPTGDR